MNVNCLSSNPFRRSSRPYFAIAGALLFCSARVWGQDNQSRCIRFDPDQRNPPGAYIVNQCQFQLNIRWRDQKECRNWNCVVGIRAGDKSYIEHFHPPAKAAVCRAPLYPNVKSNEQYTCGPFAEDCAHLNPDVQLPPECQRSNAPVSAECASARMACENGSSICEKYQERFKARGQRCPGLIIQQSSSQPTGSNSGDCASARIACQAGSSLCEKYQQRFQARGESCPGVATQQPSQQAAPTQDCAQLDKQLLQCELDYEAHEGDPLAMYGGGNNATMEAGIQLDLKQMRCTHLVAQSFSSCPGVKEKSENACRHSRGNTDPREAPEQQCVFQ
jgi:hypothetical protein